MANNNNDHGTHSRVESRTNGPWIKNTVVEYAKHSVYLQNMTSSSFSKVLVIYCGGTIGMMHDSSHGYYPVPDHLIQLLSRSESFNDPEFLAYISKLSTQETKFDISSMDPTLGPILAMPASIYGKRVAFQILEYDPLKDSCNMSMEDWVKVASDIEDHYNDYDAFVILHGTDTMAYTSSALSFMLENLGKTVIITGSQIPFAEVRNDAKDNFLGALTIAGHYLIPEVCVFFGNKLFRGNRVTKTNAVGFDAFDSPNLKPLARLGVDIEIEWAEILRATEIRRFRVRKNLDPNVGCLRLFPGITVNSIRAFLASPIRGVVLETFGTGNAPDNRPEIIQVIAEAVKRGVIVVNITQCPRGSVASIYSTGHSLKNVGVVAGGDMTAECALTKLSYLLSFDHFDQHKISRLMAESIRGELTIPIFHRIESERKKPISWLGSVFNSTMLSTTLGHRDAVDRLLRPLFIHIAASEGDLEALRELGKQDTYLDATDYDERTALHVAASCGQLEAVKWLVEHGANVHLRDSKGRTALLEAVDGYIQERPPNVFGDMIDFLVKAGARLPTTSAKVTNDLLNAAKMGNLRTLALFHRLGYDMGSTSIDGRNILYIGRLYDQQDVIDWIERTNLVQILESNLEKMS